MFHTAQAVRWTLGITVALVGIFLLMRMSIPIAYVHPDEPIAVGVMHGVIEKRSLDTNWQLHNVTRRFNWSPQYNFSSYHLLLSAFGESSRILTGTIPDLAALRVVSMAAATASVLLVYCIGLCWGGPVAALTGAVLTVASPQLFQDSLYARPESVFTLLFLLSVAISVWPSHRPVIRLVLASALVGFLVACKVSALLLVPIPLVIFIQQRTWSWQAVALSGIGTLLGAFCGAPYAFMHPELYVAGVATLMQAYGSMLAPHGLRDAPLLERAHYLLDFLNPTVGALSLFLAAWGWWSSISRRNWMIITLAVPAVLSIAYFGTGFTFVERNFSHALPVLFILAGLGLADILARVPVLPVGRVALLALLIGAAAWPAASVLRTMRFEVLSGVYQNRIETMRSQIRKQYPDIPFVTWPNLVYGRDLDIYRAITAHIAQFPFPVIIEFFHYDDRFGAEILNRFRTEFQVRQIAEVEGPFKHISPSTIQAYLAFSHPVFFVDGKR